MDHGVPGQQHSQPFHNQGMPQRVHDWESESSCSGEVYMRVSLATFTVYHLTCQKQETLTRTPEVS